MKVAIFNVMVPFIKGGAEILAEDLERELIKRNHDVDLYKIPFPDHDYYKLIDTIYCVLSLNFDEYDRVIALKFPAFYTVHKNKVQWMCHQFRQVYELWNTEYGFNEKDEMHVVMKNLITRLDNRFISNAIKIYTDGFEVQERYKKYNNGKSISLYPPLRDNSIFYNKSYGDYFYYPSRINSFKRQFLLIDAMRYTYSDVKIIISGKFENEEYRDKVLNYIKLNNIAHRVKILEGWISEEEKCRLYAESLGVVFIPYKEDYGYITAEAFYSHKPVITCKDSGGPLGLVKDGENGLVVDSSPKAIAKALDYFYENRDKAKEMGENAYNYIESANITWEETIKRLLD